MKKVKYVSNARWSKVGKSSDQHDTKKMAEGVCDLLMERYGPGTKGCETRGHCLEAWAEIHVGKSILEGVSYPITEKIREIPVADVSEVVPGVFEAKVTASRFDVCEDNLRKAIKGELP